MKTSLISVTYNRAQQMDRGLRTVLSQTVIPDEIIIVDDGSTDNTTEVVKQLIVDYLGKTIRYIYIDSPAPRISCYPRNVGIKKAKGDIIIFTESECLHIGDTIKSLLDMAAFHPDQTIVATQVWSMGQRIYQKLSPEDFAKPARILSHPYAMLVTDPNMQNTNAPDSDFGITGSNNCLTGCLFLVKKQWLLDIGGFDESFEGHGFDDFDLFERLNLYGKPILQTNDIAVIHQWHRKDYPYNIYQAAERNGTLSEKRIKTGEFRANIGKEWGQL